MSNRLTHPDRVIVVGAGLSGLTAAHRLVEGLGDEASPVEVVVLEARSRIGGAIWTDRVDGFTLEGGADSFITNKPQALDLCRSIGLGDQLIGTDDRHRRSFVVRGGKLLPVPEGFVLMAPQRLGPLLASPILSWRGKLRMAMDLVLPPRRDDADESLASFVRRRLGREALDRLVQPLVGGIYTADPEELSLRATLPQFPMMEREHGSLIRAALRQGRAARQGSRGESGARYSLFQTLAAGMDTLPETLAGALPRGAIRRSSPVRRVARQGPEGTWRVELLDGPALEARAVILAVEAHAAARLIDGEAPDLALDLRSIPYASSAIVQLGYPRDRVSHPLDGFGLVVPAVEGREILAVSFTSVKFPGRAPEGTVLLRVFIGGALQGHLFDRDDEELAALARREVGELLGASGDPLVCRVARHPRAMPQYTLGHLDRVASIRRRAASQPGLILAGNAFSGVGVPDCVRSGREAAEQALRILAEARGRAVA
ncbi:protoporphyrinogen oxidase [Tautonia plasticadhaerens]|uniref:Coproporphyrinogen III oxidase n=1 Tax=Tautonia plasticadhaerens TaxID=2527974 RepID=A0A518H560_9BACT|nr:protoporphyrinogen oxidase [Tautonia plasticadhaerens]QDV35948.1 Protoporphyrinogen oxidase [Tautonia plasticadhaerens]